ncbi:hypothetical protein, conserved [Babesia ovata]|uniref:Extracellular matrix-binding ebh n=1 Tax=Babesia ovata TaxID=189622 RepID=A0A2H6KJD8_9APIC|nr:uncharacterized protein BOVATA_045970 [Babesia ovata]GBE63104.1 hypothetical protein, conserved [Babesia ovata]
MAFLHGVLSGVKEDDNVTKYDKDDDINSIIDTLHDNVGNGREAFGDAVDKVDEKIKKVTGPLDKLLEGGDEVNFKKIPQLIQDIQGMQGKTYDEDRKGLTEKTQESLNALNSVDKQLSNKLHPHVKLMHNAVGTFRQNADEDHEGLKTVCQKADSEFQTLNDNVERGFSDVTSKLYFDIDTLKHNVANKHKTALEASIQTAKQTLVAAESKAKKYVSGTFIINKRSHFDDKFKAIEQLLADIKHDGTSVASGRESKLRVVVNSVKEGIEALDGELNSGARQMGDAIEKAVRDVGVALGQLDEKVQADLHRLLGRIEAAIKGYVTKQVEAIITGIKSVEYYSHGNNKGVKALEDALKGSALQELLRQSKDTNGFGGSLEGALYSLQQAAMKVTGQDDVNSIDQHPEVIISALFSDINRKVGKKFNNAHRKPENVPDLMENYHKWVTGKNGAEANSLKTKIDEIKKSLGRFFNRGENIDGNSEFNLGVDGKFSAYHKKRQAAVTSITKILSNIETLEKIPEAVKQARNSVEGFLNEINQNFKDLNTQVQETIKTLEQALRNLTYMIQDINAEIDSVHANVKEALQKFHGEYIRDSKNALTNLKKEALQQYAESKIKELENLIALVTEHNAKIDKIIDEDKRSSTKGLLKWMKGDADYKLENIQQIVPAQLKPSQHSEKFKTLSEKLQPYLDKLLDYIKHHVMIPGERPSPTEQSQLVSSIKTRLDTLLEYLKNHNDRQVKNNTVKRIHTFDDVSTRYLTELNDSISALSPSNFHGFHNPLLLDALKAGMTQFTEQLSHAYVNAYSGQKRTDDWVKEETKMVDDQPQKITVLSTEGRNCAKVCLTILEMMRYDFNDLLSGCSESASIQINLYNNQKLGRWFRKRGFKVNSDSGKQHGELQDKQSMRGTEIKTLLNKNIVGASGIEVLKMWKQEWMKEQDEKKSYSKQQGGTLITHKTVYNTEHINLLDIIRFLKVPLGAYYRSSHHFLPPKPRSPSNVYQMLQWLLGLYFNPMYQKLEAHIAQLFAGLKAQYKLEHPHLDVTVPDDLKKYIHSPLSSEQLTTVLRNVCLYSEDTLTAFLGRGHADGRYAVEFYTNSDQLLYPTSVGTCFDMLVDTSFRVYNQLRFVYKQCNNGTKSGGWNDCWYGQHVGGSSWNCNTKQCANQNCPQIANQKTNQSADQRCDQHPICGVKSPLNRSLKMGYQAFYLIHLKHLVVSLRVQCPTTLESRVSLPWALPILAM